MCLSIRTPKSNKFSIGSKCKINYFLVSQNLIIMCSNTGTPKIINFPFGTNGKLMVLGVPIFEHFRVICIIIVPQETHGSKFLGRTTVSYRQAESQQ